MICVYFANRLSKERSFKFDIVANIGSIKQHLHENLGNFLQVSHKLKGFDTTSYFFHMAKMKAFKKLKNHAEYTSLLQFLGKKPNVGQKEFKNHLKEFT